MAVSGGAYSLSFRNDSDDYSVAGVFNLSQDAWPSVMIEIDVDGRNLLKAEVLTSGAEWAISESLDCATEDNKIKITWKEQLAPASLFVFTLFWNAEVE
jgi:hypothetical protein